MVIANDPASPLIGRRDNAENGCDKSTTFAPDSDIKIGTIIQKWVTFFLPKRFEPPFVAHRQAIHAETATPSPVLVRGLPTNPSI